MGDGLSGQEEPIRQSGSACDRFIVRHASRAGRDQLLRAKRSAPAVLVPAAPTLRQDGSALAGLWKISALARFARCVVDGSRRSPREE